MRFVAEYLEDTAQILLRFLSTESGLVPAGTYIVDATPRIPEALSLDLDSDAIKNGEAHFCLTGFWPLPDWIEITSPDLSKTVIPVSVVVTKTSTWEPLLADQSIDALTPISPEVLRPGEGNNPYVPEQTLPPEYPSFIAELSLERTDAARLGVGITSDPLSYRGGVAGRALSATHRQQGADMAPYVYQSPTRLEGSFTNSLQHSSFHYSPSWPSPYFDDLPNGWSVELTDPMDLIRFQTSEPSTILPTFTMRYRQRTGGDIRTAIPPVTVLTPAVVNIGETFQAIILAGAKNAEGGKVVLKTEDGSLTSPTYNLVDGAPVIASLNVGTHTGRVRIVWDTAGDGEEQILQVIAPSAALYTGGHSWIPYGSTSGADSLTLNNICFDKIWYFHKGTIRVDGQGDEPSQPFSWEIKLGSSTFMKVEEGILSSDYMTGTSVMLADYLANVTRYRLVWSAPGAFVLSDTSGGSKVSLPFAFDISAILDSILPLSVTLKGYKPDEGSLIAKRWAWLPIA